jgi:hypothetical protein
VQGGGGRQIIQQLDPRLPLKLCLLPPLFLDYRLNARGGYDLPRYPYLFRRATLSLTKWWPLTCTASGLSRLLQKGSTMSFGADSLRFESLGA